MSTCREAHKADTIRPNAELVRMGPHKSTGPPMSWFYRARCRMHSRGGTDRNSTMVFRERSCFGRRPWFGFRSAAGPQRVFLGERLTALLLEPDCELLKCEGRRDVSRIRSPGCLAHRQRTG